MKKKLMILAVLAMLLAVVFAVNVSAAEYTCQCCGKAYSQVNWQPWTITQGGTATTLTADGHYYLTGNVTSVTAQIRIGDSTLKPKITLDLRGHTIKSSKRVFGVYAGSTLSVVDSVGGGKVIGRQDDANQVGGTIRVNEGATLNVYGGTVQNVADVVHEANGGVIATEGKNCIINIAGGTVRGNTFAPNGGAIFAARGAKVTVSAGSVIAGTAYQGGAIHLNNATLTVTGGTVGTDSSDTTALLGGTIYGVNATVNISGGTIGGGMAYQGGAIYLENSALTLSGGTIQGGAASLMDNTQEALAQYPDAGCGGAIYTIAGATVNLNGGTVNGGSAVYGGAIYAADNSKITVNGATVNGSVCESGGAIAMRAATLEVKQGTINGGQVNGYGSAIHLFEDKTNGVACTVTISGGTVSSHAETKRAAISMAANAHAVTLSGGQVKGANAANSAGACFAGQGTGATITINGGTLSGVSSAKVDRSGLIYSRGKVIINGGTFNVTGDGAAVYMYQKYCNLTVKSTMYDAMAGRIWMADGAKSTKGAAVASDRIYVWYPTSADAVTAAKDGQIVKLLQSGDVNLQGKTLYLDINGYIPTVTNGHFYGMDSAGDTYKASKCGYTTGTATYDAFTTAPDGRQYLTVVSGTQASFHRISFGIEDVSLRTEMGREGMYFSSNFAGDEVVKTCVDIFGIAMSKQNLGADENWVAAMKNGTAIYSAFGQHRFQAGVDPANQPRTTGTLLKNIVQRTNSVQTNVENSQTTVYSRAYIRLTDGTYLMDTQQQASLMQMLQWSDSNFSKLSQLQQAGLLLMYERFMSFMNQVPTTNIRVAYDDNVLAARRETVWKEMLDMNNILWSVDHEVTYSFHASSKGVEADLAAEQAKDKHDPLNDDMGTFYPDRIYQGLPYTHASGNNAAIQNLGVQDEYGVYHIDANPSMFTGGSTDGSTATTGQYNVARIGNDCWDMVHWAWSKVSTTLTADQTRQMTPDYGVLLVGMDILEQAMHDSGAMDTDVELLDHICSTGSNGKRIYRIIADTEPNGTIDGTRMIRYGTRTQNADGTYDYQVLYRTYTMLQRGDAMVRYRNSNGHAIMVGGVTVVYNDDGTINGEKSTIVMLEQGSANEEYQARPESEFSTTATAAHKSHTSVNKSCMYCCGYTDQVIDGKHVWMMDHPPKEVTFKSLVEADYIGVTCQELNDNTPGEPLAVSYQNTSGNVSAIYSGSLVSNYRIAAVTLDIYDAAGELVNTSTMFGIQSGVRSALKLSRFMTDQTVGAYGSVVAGTPALRTSGTNIVTDLPAGNYTFVYTCELGTEQKVQFATGSFTVNKNGNCT